MWPAFLSLVVRQTVTAPGGTPLEALNLKESLSPWEQNSPDFSLLPMGMLSFLSVILTNTQTHSLLF